MAAEAQWAGVQTNSLPGTSADERRNDLAGEPGVTRQWPRISVILPVRNEAASLPGLLAQLLAQDYPRDRFEILVADGRSTDSTREGVLALAAGSLVSIRLVDNPAQRSGPGRSAGVLASTGEVILFLDGHCELLSTSLLADTTRLLAATGAACLCRPQPLLARAATATGRTIAVARASWLGHGRDSLIYDMDHAGFVDPASSGATYRREVFAQVGLYDPQFDACEDVELNIRVRKAGLTAYTHPSLAVYYEPRSTLGGLWRQMVRYGRGRVRLMTKHPETASAAQLAPALLLLCCVLAPAGLALSPRLAVVVALPALVFAAAALACSTQLCLRHGWRVLWEAPLVFAIIYGGLGSGLLLEAARRAARLTPGPVATMAPLDAGRQAGD